ncbi:MAG: HTTM domain-containing protein, partial [Nonlabens sp.]
MYSKWDKWLFTQVDNSALVIFRMIFGLLIACEAFGSIALGAVRRLFIEPDFTFTFIGFEFLEPLPGNWMYV